MTQRVMSFSVLLVVLLAIVGNLPFAIAGDLNDINECSKYTKSATCLTASEQCYWCTSDKLDTHGCYTQTLQKLMPSFLFNCTGKPVIERVKFVKGKQSIPLASRKQENDNKDAKQATSCSGNEVGDLNQCGKYTKSLTCLAGSEPCYWCSSKQFNTKGCYTETIQKLMPSFLFNCTGKPTIESKGEAKSEDDADTHNALDNKKINPGFNFGDVNECAKYTKSLTCLAGSEQCYWCTSDKLDTNGCYTQTIQKLMPSFLFNCTGKPTPS